MTRKSGHLNWRDRHAAYLLVLVAGCGPSGGERRVSLEAGDPSDRVRAIVAIVEQGQMDRRSAVAGLVDRLEDEDEVVRFYAVAALDRLTGKRLGFRAYDPASRRRLAVERWREYLASGQSVGPEPSP